MMRNIGGLRIRGWNVAVACGCLWLAACGGKVIYGDDADGGSETGGKGGSGGTGGYGGTGGQVTGGYGGGGYGGTGGQVTGGYGGGGYGGTAGYGGGGYGGGGYGGGGYGGTAGYGGTGYGGTGGGTQCALSTSDPTCDSCFQHACEYECVNVMAEPSTNDYLMCMQGCSDQYCYDSCSGQYPSAAHVMNMFQNCMTQQCAYECGTPPGDCGLTTGTPECDNCFYAACNYECSVATNEPSLMDYINCYQYCQDQTCAEACDAQYPNAASALNTLTSCIDANCITECGAMN